jgi:predicted nucleic acid-binding protein
LIVVDASALAGALLDPEVGAAFRERISKNRETLHAPHLLDLEVAQVFRRYALQSLMTAERSEEAFRLLRALRITRYAPHILLPRIWALRWNITAYDAAYVALAELLDAPLLTSDARLAASAGHTARIELLR